MIRRERRELGEGEYLADRFQVIGATSHAPVERVGDGVVGPSKIMRSNPQMDEECFVREGCNFGWVGGGGDELPRLFIKVLVNPSWVYFFFRGKPANWDPVKGICNKSQVDILDLLFAVIGRCGLKLFHGLNLGPHPVLIVLPQLFRPLVRGLVPDFLRERLLIFGATGEYAIEGLHRVRDIHRDQLRLVAYVTVGVLRSYWGSGSHFDRECRGSLWNR